MKSTERRASAAGKQLHYAQVVDERHADSGPLQAVVRRGVADHGHSLDM
jgi:hypothetical protein